MIFDMDGVLVDGEPLHFQAAATVLAQEGATLDLATYQSCIGRTLDAIWPILQARYALRIPRADYQARYDALVTEQYRTRSHFMPGAAALLERVAAAGLPRALASSSRRGWMDAALAALHLHGYFHATVAGDEVREGKPAPEIYLTAAARLGQAPADCLVVEDAPAGIQAARAAGMRVVAVRTGMTAGLSLDGADAIIDSLEAFDPAWLSSPARRN